MKVVVYGIGNNFARNFNWIRKYYTIVGLADGDTAKQGTKIDNFTITNIKGILALEYDKVIITPNSYYEITQNLVEAGIKIEDIYYLPKLLRLDNVGNELTVCFRIMGGMGDALVALNYIYYFRNKFLNDCLKIYLECEPGRESVSYFCNAKGFVRGIHICKDKEAQVEKYDLYIKIKRYPEVIKKEMNKISRLVPELVDYVLQCEKFKIFNPRYFVEGFAADGSSALLEELSGRKRIQQPDFYRLLGVAEEYAYPIDAREEILKNFGLKPYQFITLHRGCERKNYDFQSVKLWPEENYTKLIMLIKCRFPNICIVMLGEGYECIDNIEGYDLDLVGKTDSESLKALLKYSSIHIDTEGGMVHLRHALNGGSSVVLFGPTSDKFFGYSENVNIRTQACPYPCEWVTHNWSRQCIRQIEPFVCMHSITPDKVMDAVLDLLG